jgi:hypothetical protein
MIPRQQFGQKIENPELGVNVFMVPKGVSTENPQFSLVYKDRGGNLIPLQTEGGRDVLVRLGGEAKAQAAEIARRFKDPEYKAAQEARERSIGGAVMGGLGGGMGAKIDPRYPVAPAPVDPVKIIDPTVYGDTTEPNLQQSANGGRARGGGKALDYPRRRDGMTDPMSDLPYPDPNSPGRKAGNVSLEEPGYRGFRIPGMDGPTHLVAVARDDNTKFFVRNQSGPRAGEVVTIHPDFAVGLASMVESMPKEIRSEFKIGSAVRSFDQQEGIYRAAQAKRGEHARMWAAPPGHSNHEHGIAADLSMGPAAKAWVHANAAKFGLWFPMKHEPWHIEPIGSRQRADAGSDQEAT